ncbi:Gingipain R1 [Pontiella desulfatans]|uniref:Gingipain R1 n=1 Tax=Pontiella desulfatans TaxID=2750659 RepID=A0A6C2U8Q4_PONDE|nr:C25 family cysteine peptidase [Pontiella desulfatans]VGO16335.1 Gingipain R1 [Pontiella desulfatans]
MSRLRKVWTVGCLVVLVLLGFVVSRQNEPVQGGSVVSNAPNAPQRKVVEPIFPEVQVESEILRTEALSDTQARLNLDFPVVSFSDVTLEDGNAYQTAHLPQTGLLPMGEGRPTLPLKTLMVAIPPGAEFDVQLAAGETTVMSDVLLAPAERLIKMNGDDKESTFAIDDAFYAADESFPADPLYSARRVSLRGREFIEVRVAPLRYNPAKRELEVAETVAVEVEIFPTAGGVAPAEDPLYSPAFDSMTTEGDYSFPGYMPTNVVFPGGIGPEKYMIIYNEKFQDNPHFQEFIEWKRRKGYEVVLKTTKSIGGSNCNASEISNYLKGLPDEDWPTYLLLVGRHNTTTGVAMHKRFTSYSSSCWNDHFYSLRTKNQEVNEEWGTPSKVWDWSNASTSPDGLQLTISVPYDNWGFIYKEVEPGDEVLFEGGITSTVASVNSYSNLTLTSSVYPGASNLTFSIDVLADFNPADWVDEYPDLFVGRIPANDNGMLSSMLEKMMLMDRNPPQSGSHYERNILVGAKDGALQGPEPMIDALGVYFEREYGDATVERAFNGGNYTPGQWLNPGHSMFWPDKDWQVSDGFVAKNCSSNTEAKEKLKREWGQEEGAALVHYICHGGEQGWYWNNKGSTFTIDELAELNTPERYAMVMDYSCDTAGWNSSTNFTQVALCNPNGGAYSMISACQPQWGGIQDYQFYGYLSGVFTNWFDFFIDAFEEGVDDDTVTYPAFSDPTLPITYSPGHAPRMGQMWWCGKVYTLENYPADDLLWGADKPDQPVVGNHVAYENMIMQNLFGDPEAFMVFSAPTPLAATLSASVGPGASTVQVTTEEGAQVALYSDALNIHLVAIADTNGVASFDIAPVQAGAVAVTASKFGRVPFEGGFAVGANNAPVFSQSDIFQTTVKAAEACEDSLAAFASDPDGDGIKFSITDGPDWLKMLDNGTYYGTPDFSDIGSNEFTVQVEDDSGASDTAVMTIIVNPNDAFNTAPYANEDPIQLSATVAGGISGSLTNHVFDDEGDVLSFSKTAGDAWLTIATNGMLSGYPPAATVGDNAFDVTVSDGVNLAMIHLNISVAPASEITVLDIDFQGSEAGRTNLLAATEAERGTILSNGTHVGVWSDVAATPNLAYEIQQETDGTNKVLAFANENNGTKMVADLLFDYTANLESGEVLDLSWEWMHTDGKGGGSGDVFLILLNDAMEEVATLKWNDSSQLSLNGTSFADRLRQLPIDPYVEITTALWNPLAMDMEMSSTNMALSIDGAVVTNMPFTAATIKGLRFKTASNRTYSEGGAWMDNILATVTPPLPVSADADEDGIPDNWEAQFGLSGGNAADAALDIDGDGLTALQEYIADTNPTNPASCLVINSLVWTNGQFWVDWNGGINATQYFECAENLVSNHWTELRTYVPPTTTNQSMTVTNAPSAECFFRIRSAR